MDLHWMQAARRLSRSPGFTIIAVISLSLGLAGNLSFYRLMDSVLWGDLPFRDPSRLVRLQEMSDDGRIGGISWPNFLDWRGSLHSYSALAAYGSIEVKALGGPVNTKLDGEMVDENYFSTLGVAPHLGHLPKGPEAAISNSLWQRAFASDPAVLGRTLKVGDALLTISAVMPPGFSGLGKANDIWLPLDTHPAVFSQHTRRGVRFLELRDIKFLNAVGRLKPAITLQQASAETNALTAQLARTYPRDNAGRGKASLQPLREEMAGASREVVILLAAAGLFLFLIACANVANLFLLRGERRERELAVRTALGASASDTCRIFLSESALIALASAILGAFALLLGDRGTPAFPPGGPPLLGPPRLGLARHPDGRSLRRRRRTPPRTPPGPPVRPHRSLP